MINGFDRIARFYDQLTRIVFGNAIRKSQLFFLEQLRSTHSVLVLGGGTGWWLNELLIINPRVRITYIDASDKMLTIAKAKVNNDSIQFIHGTQNDIPLEGKYDAVVLFYFLDLFNPTELLAVVEVIEAKLLPGAQWLVADFVEEQKWHSVLLQIMYRFFYFTTGLSTCALPDWRRTLREKDLKLIDQKSFYGNFIWSTWWG